ncbi:acetoacetate decarboxylase family protein [Microvirga sp. GCM10011540]|uniref:acetoacetate decarboxylase family protein n=1 Tax=Microvirga sp. GCM10011540 TaxID=3317338 RepID=UPI003621D54F
MSTDSTSKDADLPYPPAPWHLVGTLYASLWSIPLKDLPLPLPPGTRPLTLYGRTLIGTAWAVYEPPGTLSYDELLVALRVQSDNRTCTYVPLIWVDSPASVAGARAMWGIPKEFASFGKRITDDSFEASAAHGDNVFASLNFRPRVSLPGRWPLRTSIVQTHGEGVRLSRARASARIETGRAEWHFATHSPLRFLGNYTPLLSARLSEMKLTFGL